MIPPLRAFSKPLLLFVAAIIAARPASPQSQTGSADPGTAGRPNGCNNLASARRRTESQPAAVAAVRRRLPYYDWKDRTESNSVKQTIHIVLGRLAAESVRSSPPDGSAFLEKPMTRASSSTSIYPADCRIKIPGTSARRMAEFGSSTEGWIDVIIGRQVLGFGKQRLIGPSNWSNTGRHLRCDPSGCASIRATKSVCLPPR